MLIISSAFILPSLALLISEAVATISWKELINIIWNKLSSLLFVMILEGYSIVSLDKVEFKKEHEVCLRQNSNLFTRLKSSIEFFQIIIALTLYLEAAIALSGRL